LSIEVSPSNFTIAQKKHLVLKETYYHLIAGSLYKLCENGNLQPSVLAHKRTMILLEACEGIEGGKYARKVMDQKIMCRGIWWPTIHNDANALYQTYDV
jgi:hypothetical protein